MTEYVDRRHRVVDAPIDTLFAAVRSIGGEHGWHSARWLWRLRGFLDRLAGGCGIVPRPQPDELEIGDMVDFWRVTALEPPHRLRMLTEMSMPGVGILEFEITPVDPGGCSCRLSQTATFVPKGSLGHLYWIVLIPIHAYIFRKLIVGLARQAEAAVSAPAPRGR